MNEGTFWTGRVKPALHQPPDYVARKIQDQWNAGLPDVAYCLKGHAGWLELKYKPRPARASTMIKPAVSQDQRRWLQMWEEAGGVGSVLLGIGDWWLLARWDIPEEIRNGALKRWLVNTTRPPWLLACGEGKGRLDDVRRAVILRHVTVGASGGGRAS
jgi:hypothetical protein